MMKGCVGKLREKELLESYRSIWKGRSLHSESDEEAERILIRSIRAELLDEHTHPRLRISKEKKFFQGIKRIMSTELDMKEKYELIELFIEVLESL